MYKTHTCGELGTTHIGQEVTLAGWVHRYRDHGGVLFVDLRDRFGIVQVVLDPDQLNDQFKTAEQIRAEWVIQINGIVRARPAGSENPNMATGMIEISASNLKSIECRKSTAVCH